MKSREIHVTTITQVGNTPLFRVYGVLADDATPTFTRMVGGNLLHDLRVAVVHVDKETAVSLAADLNRLHEADSGEALTIEVDDNAWAWAPSGGWGHGSPVRKGSKRGKS